MIERDLPWPGLSPVRGNVRVMNITRVLLLVEDKPPGTERSKNPKLLINSKRKEGWEALQQIRGDVVDERSQVWR